MLGFYYYLIFSTASIIVRRRRIAGLHAAKSLAKARWNFSPLLFSRARAHSSPARWRGDRADDAIGDIIAHDDAKACHVSRFLASQLPAWSPKKRPHASPPLHIARAMLTSHQCRRRTACWSLIMAWPPSFTRMTPLFDRDVAFFLIYAVAELNTQR